VALTLLLLLLLFAAWHVAAAGWMLLLHCCLHHQQQQQHCLPRALQALLQLLLCSTHQQAASAHKQNPQHQQPSAHNSI
jgi:hypothetical protein